MSACSSCGGVLPFIQKKKDARGFGGSSPVSPTSRVSSASLNGRAPRVVQLAHVEVVDTPRLLVHPSIDLVLGGLSNLGEVEPGVAIGSTFQISADPGAGKSTLLLQACANVATYAPALYATGEESLSAIRMRAERLGVFENPQVVENLCAIATRTFEQFIDEVKKRRPALAIYDSIQVARSSVHLDAPARSTKMTSYATELSFETAHALNGPIIGLVCQVIKDGDPAGPMANEHALDATLFLERVFIKKVGTDTRVLSCRKNRNGPESQRDALVMGPHGLVRLESSPPSAVCNDDVKERGERDRETGP